MLQVCEHNLKMLNSLDTPLIKIFAIDKLPLDSELSNVDITWIQHASLSETRGLPYELDIKIGARIMITKNIDIEDKLINGQIGVVQQIELRHSKVTSIYVKFDDDKAGTISMRNDPVSRVNRWVKIERVESVFNTKKRFLNSPSVCRTQFPLMLSWACKCHKVQGLTLPSAVISFQLYRQKQFNAGQMYVALSRVTSLSKLYLLGNYAENAIRVNSKADIGYERLQQENVFEPIETVKLSLNTVSITLLNT